MQNRIQTKLSQITWIIILSFMYLESAFCRWFSSQTPSGIDDNLPEPNTQHNDIIHDLVWVWVSGGILHQINYYNRQDHLSTLVVLESLSKNMSLPWLALIFHFYKYHNVEFCHLQDLSKKDTENIYTCIKGQKKSISI